MAGFVNGLLAQLHYNRRLSRRRPIYRNREDAFGLRDDVFIRDFKLSKHLVDQLCTDIRDDLEALCIRENIVSVETKVLCALQFYATGSYQGSVAADFCVNISQPSVSRAVRKVSWAIFRKLYSRWVVFPTNIQELRSIKQQFSNIAGFPGIIGAIDCSHILIAPPPVDHPLYPEHIFVDRDHKHSLNVQMVCKVDLTITSCLAKYPGSSHDSHIWRNSCLRTKVIDLHSQANCWLIGDSGYPVEPWLQIPAKVPGNHRTGTTPEEAFNKSHRRTRNPIERCFGVLKSRFRCLNGERVLHYSPPTVACIVYACVVLHNMCRRHGIPDPEIVPDRSSATQQEEEVPTPSIVRAQGIAVQRRIIEQYFTN